MARNERERVAPTNSSTHICHSVDCGAIAQNLGVLNFMRSCADFLKASFFKIPQDDNLVGLTKRAFTLVELAIVLVIIGLLTAGVVGGQSLIESAKRSKITTDLTGYQTSLRAFQLEYDAIPGDFKDAGLYWTGATNGNGTSHINGYPGGGAESWNFWIHLSLANILPGTFSGVSGSGNCCYHGVPGTNSPAGPVDGTGYNIQYVGVMGNNIDSYAWGTYYATSGLLFAGVNYGHLIMHGAATSTSWTAGGSFTPKFVKNIDDKMDDGNPASGVILNLPQGSTGLGGGTSTCVSGTTSTATYLLSSSSKLCAVYYKLTE